MAEENFVFRINYQLEGVERSISTSRRALFTLNAIRLSIRDIQQVISGPTLSNVLWTAIQLTRTLTQARRLTKALAAEQAGLGAASAFGLGVGSRAGRGAAGRALAAGQVTLGGGALGGPGFFASLIAFAAANPLLVGAVGGASVGVAFIAFSARERRIRESFRVHNREVAKAQGLEP
jgi:hypothetical protein